jgi:hypothetical protein
MAVTKPQMTGLTGAIWDDLNPATVSISNGGAVTGTIIGGTGTSTISTMSGTGNTFAAMRTPTEVILDRYQLNELTVQHRVQEFELMKLRESNVDYATEIKRNLAKMASEEVTAKMSFTKKTEVNTDTHSFRGRIWVFSKEELIKMIEEIRNGI